MPGTEGETSNADRGAEGTTSQQLLPVKPPKSFDFSNYEEWPRWLKRFDRYRIVSGLQSQAEDLQVNALIYAMGGDAEDIMASFVFADESDAHKYDAVKAKFNSHFVAKKNVIYERAKFNQRAQGQDESVENFITALHSLAEFCEYGSLKDEMIRGRLVVGLRNEKLSEKLQIDASLTLEKAVQQARQSESAKKQQGVIRSSHIPSSNVETLEEKQAKSGRPRGSHKPKQPSKSSGDGNNSKFKRRTTGCERCGNPKNHNRQSCPAKDVKCHKCSKQGHFAKWCHASVPPSKVYEVEAAESSSSDSDIFLGEVVSKQEKPWTADVTINSHRVTFKLDCGADVTVLPSKIFTEITDKPILLKTSKKLYGPCRYELKCKGEFEASLKYENKSCKEQIYVLDNLDRPLLGRTACHKLGIIKKIDDVVSPERGPDRMKKTHPNLFKGLGCMPGEHEIKLSDGAKPFNLTTPRRIPIPLLDNVKAEIKRMEDMEVIERVDQPTEWCSPVVVVPKKNGKVRICGDFIQLNKAVQRENHPMPTTEQTLAKLTGAKIVSKLDANSGFWQRKLSPKSKLLTTFITPWGRYCYKRLPFGISSAPEHFQKTMQYILAGLEGVECQMDDILVFGNSYEQHDERLEAVLRCLEEHGVTLNLEKCEFAKENVGFLGHVIGKDGIQADPSKVEAIKWMKAPSDVSDLRRFLGMVNQMGKYLPNLAQTSKPLRELLTKDSAWLWDTAQKEAFEEIKRQLISTPVLAIYDPQLETTVSADASSYGIGAVLTQKQSEGYWKPVAFISRALTSTEQRYAQIEKEALATTWACERLADYLVGKTFHVETDHKPLVPLLGSKNLDEMPPRIQRLRMRLLRFHFTISHVPGKNLVTADALSRAPLQPTPSHAKEEEIDLYVDSVLLQLPATDKRLEEISAKQQEDPVCKKLLEYCEEGWPDFHKIPSSLSPYWSSRGEISQVRGLLLKGSRLIIPSSMRLEILEQIHEGHQGIVKCRRRAKDSVWWPGLSNQVQDMVTSCRKCIEYRKPNREPMIPTAVPERPWQILGTDLFSLNGRAYLVVVDYFSRYVEVSLLTASQKSSDTIRALKSIFARHGVPEILRSDNGPQFASTEFDQFSKDYSFTHITSSPKLPQANGEAERAVQTVKNTLKKGKDPAKALMSYRATPLENGYSPAEMLFGRKIQKTVPVFPDQLKPSWPDLEKVRTHEQEGKLTQTSRYNSSHRCTELPKLSTGDRVWVTDQKTPAMVTEKAPTPRSYMVETEAGSSIRRNRRHLVAMPESTIKDTPLKRVESSPTKPLDVSPQKMTSSDVKTSRSGRVIKPPDRLDL